MNHIEKMAREIYGSIEWAYAADSNFIAPKWVDGGNSYAQVEARKQAQVAFDALIEAVPDLEWETYDHWKYAPADRAIGVNCEYILQDPLDERADWSLVSIPNSGPMKFETLGGYDYSVAEVNTRNRAQVRKLFGGE
ncbi:MAG: hypothetical protein KAT58_02725 [candidate division Zixibacteria bacterium]|nr:hypothetical protein [candidate division Zixibacteria bacterium]